MNQSNKKKLEQFEAKKKVSGPMSSGVDVEKVQATVNQLQSQWNTVIKDLQGEIFPDFSSALEKLVDKVMSSMGLEDDQIRQSLMTVVETDPGLSETLKKTLKISNN